MESWRKPKVAVSISTRTPGAADCCGGGAVGVDVAPEHPAIPVTTISTHARNTSRTRQVYALNRGRVAGTYRICADMLFSKRTRWTAALVVSTGFLSICGMVAQSSDIDAKLFGPLHWRLIGPYRAGRVTSVAGVSGDANTYYFGTPGGGVWKTTTG